MKTSSYLQDILSTIADQGRNLLPRSLRSAQPEEDIRELAAALLSVRGEASGVAIASEILGLYEQLDQAAKLGFLHFLAESMDPETQTVRTAADAYFENPSAATLRALRSAAEGPRQSFFRRLNMPTGATAKIVAMRRDLLEARDPKLASVDHDLMHLLVSWFNRGFLVLRRIDWQTPAAILEKIIRYEAVHEIQGWDDLRRRLDPADRRCFAFFHPSLVDEPLIFVEVALMRAIPENIHSVLREARKTGAPASEPTTAVFYSISNCQEGLRGISFGNFLIKQVVEELRRDYPALDTFVTLSPVPGFAAWLKRERHSGSSRALTQEDLEALANLDIEGWWQVPETREPVEEPLMRAAAWYFLYARNARGLPADPVARFHLGNGARLEQMHFLADGSENGIRQSFGVMVNYLYDLDDIEKNHEAFAENRMVVASSAVRKLARPGPTGDVVPLASKA